MSLHTSAHSPGVFVPHEMAMLQGLLEDMRAEPWFPQCKVMQDKLASFLIRTYDRGMACPDKLKAFCAVAVRLYFHDQETPGGTLKRASG